MRVPALTASLTDNRKSKVGKTLLNFANDLKIVIKQGEDILNQIEIVALAKSNTEIKESLEKLKEFIGFQLELLEDMGKQLDIGLYDKADGKLPRWGRSIDVQSIVNVYEPDMGHSVYKILHAKGIVLRNTYEVVLSALVKPYIENIKDVENTLNIKQVTYIDIRNISFDITDSWRLDEYPGEVFNKEKIEDYEKRGYIQTSNVNLNSNTEREKYLNKAHIRLNELESARQKLIELIKRYYEPHHLV